MYTIGQKRTVGRTTTQVEVMTCIASFRLIKFVRLHASEGSPISNIPEASTVNIRRICDVCCFVHKRRIWEETHQQSRAPPLIPVAESYVIPSVVRQLATLVRCSFSRVMTPLFSVPRPLLYMPPFPPPRNSRESDMSDIVDDSRGVVVFSSMGEHRGHLT